MASAGRRSTSGSATWTVPAERMKAHRQHRVPLSPFALQVLRRPAPWPPPVSVGELANSGPTCSLVFPGRDAGRPLSDMTLTMRLRRLRVVATAHGFRTSFKTWAAEAGVPDEVSEAALAHVDKDKVRSAYQRSDLLEPRRQVMSKWGEFITGVEGNFSEHN